LIDYIFRDAKAFASPDSKSGASTKMQRQHPGGSVRRS
jgi:hypothetical protein